MRPFAKVAAIVAVVLVMTVLPGTPVNAAPSIGVVKLIKVNAYGTPTGESQREIFVRSEIFPSELVETVAQGAAHLRFNDETEIRIGSAGRLVLDSFVYARGSQPDRLIASFSRGALRFISGLFAGFVADRGVGALPLSRHASSRRLTPPGSACASACSCRREPPGSTRPRPSRGRAARTRRSRAPP